MRYIYVAGPYSGTPEQVKTNVENSIKAFHAIMDMGFYPFVPHLFHYCEAVRQRSYESWMAIDLAWLKKCDCVYRLPGASPGADREEKIAVEELKIPVFFELDAMKWYLDSKIRSAPKR